MFKATERKDTVKDKSVAISKDAALAAIGALSILEKQSGLDEKCTAAMNELMDALVASVE